MTEHADMSQLEVRNNTDKHRFEVPLGDQVAMLTYEEGDSTIALNHTAVPPAYREQGIASKMARAALQYAKAHNLRVIPNCPFVASYIKQHPEYQPLTVTVQDE